MYQDHSELSITWMNCINHQIIRQHHKLGLIMEMQLLISTFQALFCILYLHCFGESISSVIRFVESLSSSQSDTIEKVFRACKFLSISKNYKSFFFLEVKQFTF